MKSISGMTDAIEKKHLEVRHHNEITSSRHDLSAIQLDIYFMLLSKLTSAHVSDTEYCITVKEIEALTDREWSYNQLREATRTMVGKVFEIESETGVLQVAMLSSAEYVHGQGKVNIMISPKLAPYLIQIKGNYTSFELYCVLSMTSKYAKWLYIIFSRWDDLGMKTYLVDELRYMLNLKGRDGKPDVYPRWIHFNDRVLKPAIMQINQFTDLTITYDPKPTKGRAITEITFIISKRKSIQRIIPFDLPESDEKGQNLILSLKEIGIVDKEIIKKVLDSPELRIAAHKWFFGYRQNKDKIKSPAGHFRKSLAV